MRDININLERQTATLDDLTQRLAHKSVCNVSVKRNQTTLTKGLAVIEELVKSGRLHAEGETEVIRTPERLREYMEHAKKNGEYIVDVETTGLDVYNDILVGICLYVDGKPSAYVPFNHTEIGRASCRERVSPRV